MGTEWASLLLEADIDVPFGTDEFNILCPFHSDTVASCSINIDKGVWICHAGCGQGSLKYFLAKILNQSPEEIEEFKKDYPDVYGVVETVSKLQAEAKAVELEERISALRKREEEASYKTAEQELLSLHPDFAELRKDAEFLDWLDTQPSTIADGIYKNRTDAKWAARVLDLYKLDSGKVNQKKQPRSSKSAAEAVTKTKKSSPKTTDDDKKIWTTQEISRLKPHEFEKLEAELDAANREGRII